ncbi:MAG TPA: hypothetical protein VK955_13830, partial [Xanthobacteraceae bacterium]|nr:hypothetical protein [Xanthobacteraceae bacterium]
MTVTDAFDVLPVPPLVELTCTLLFFVPGVVPITLTTTVHEALAATVALARLADEAPAIAVAVPPQVFVNPFGVATTKPAGRLSVNATPVCGPLAFGLATVNVSDVVLDNAIVGAPKAFRIVAGTNGSNVAVTLLLAWTFVSTHVAPVQSPLNA